MDGEGEGRGRRWGGGGGEGDEGGPAALGYRLFLVLKISVMYVVVSFFFLSRSCVFIF